MKKVFVLLMACASLIACDKKENDAPQNDLTEAEIAALEKEATDHWFAERLSGMLIDSETNQPQGIKLNEEGTYAISVDDGEVARGVVKFLMGGYQTETVENEQSYRYAYTFADGRKVEAAGSLASNGGVYASLSVDVETLPAISALLIKTEAALQDDNGSTMPGAGNVLTDVWWECQLDGCHNIVNTEKEVLNCIVDGVLNWAWWEYEIDASSLYVLDSRLHTKAGYNIGCSSTWDDAMYRVLLNTTKVPSGIVSSSIALKSSCNHGIELYFYPPKCPKCNYGYLLRKEKSYPSRGGGITF